eukprot:XP_011684069.1 PREDICTED: uncharacterized protein LOC100888146 [Strongylocentrotus purpuratus]
MAVNVIRFIAWLFFLATLTRAEDCDVESKNCTCVMPKLYDCPEVDLSLNPVPDGCPLLNEKLAGTDFSDLTCGGENDTFEPISGAISFTADGRWLEFENEACNDEFYFIVDLNGGQLVKTLKMEDMNPSVTTGQNVSFEVAYGYTVPCTDQPTLNTLLWQYITPGWYASDADITKVWNRLNFTNGAFGQVEATYFKASYLFVHFNHIPVNSRFRLSVTGCHETGKDIAPALEYLNSLLSVTNDTLEIVQGIAVSGTAIQSENNLTDDEVVLFLDAFASFEDKSLDLSNEPEEAQNLTDGFAEVASKVLSSITFVSIPLEHSGVYTHRPSGLYTAGANEHTTSHNADKRVADQQARAILAIEQAYRSGHISCWQCHYHRENREFSDIVSEAAVVINPSPGFDNIDICANDLDVEFMTLDLSSIASTMSFVEEFKAKGLPLHILVCNAGMAYGGEASRGNAKIILVSSMAYRGAGWHEDNMQSINKGQLSKYGSTKLYQIMEMFTLAEKLDGFGIGVFSLHPGFVDTDIVKRENQQVSGSMKFFVGMLNSMGLARNSFDGALTTIHAAVNPQYDGKTALYLENSQPTSLHNPLATDRDKQEFLWKYSLDCLKDYITEDTLKELTSH